MTVPCSIASKSFQSTHSLRSATQVTVPCSIASNLFQSTHSLRSATRGEAQRMMHDPVSIHALLAECDFRSSALSAPRSCFNPRTPCGVRQTRKPIWTTTIEFQSTHSLRSATTTARRTPPPWKVSIHALLAECDHKAPSHQGPQTGFNPRTPCGVRPQTQGSFRRSWSFNPRTPCGVRPGYSYAALKSKIVSIHALLAECDGITRSLPASVLVSIHALLAECDKCLHSIAHHLNGFNPRTPCGVRLAFVGVSQHHSRFQSTHSLRSATFCNACTVTISGFQSTHSLRSATAPDLIHCYSTEQIILCANLPKKTVIARLLFLSIYLSIFYSQCITPIADLPGNSCELEVGAQAMFNSL